MKAYILFLFLILFNTIYSQDDDYDPTAGDELADKNNCEDLESTVTCQERILSKEGNLCCDIYEETADSVSETCEVKTTKEQQMLIVGSSEVINKELGGLQMYNSKYGGTAGDTIEERKEKVQRTIRITCKTWDFSVNIIDGEDYTEDEIKILESENHCLSYFNPILLHISSNRRSVTRETCYKASLLPSTRREGLSCGYLEIDIQEEHSIVEKRQTCFLYDPKVASSRTLDEATRLNFNGLSKKAENDNINYQFTIFGYNGTGYSYDSKTRVVTEKEDDPNLFNYTDFLLKNDMTVPVEEENEPKDNEQTNGSSFVNIGRLKYNFIALFILFML